MMAAMNARLLRIINAYDPSRPLARALTVPSAWYTDRDLYELERRAVFGGTWQCIGRIDQLAEPGRYVTADIAGEPIVAVRGRDGKLRAFHNVCRHHAAAIATQPEGSCKALRCPYHGWTYGLDGRLKGTPEFDGVEDFDKSANGLLPVQVEAWAPFVFACLDEAAPCLPEHARPLKFEQLGFFERRTYDLNCNWKVFVDNYLDGGYHVPHIHAGLGSVLDYAKYRVECFERWCVQVSPMAASSGDSETASVRGGEAAFYYWLHPNFMVNWYEGVMDTNLVLPLGVDRCRVIFDFYFAATSEEAVDYNRRSIAVAQQVQQEDIDVCESVQRGLGSRAYDVGRLSVRREAGEHLFHRLLHADLSRECARADLDA
jgi:choline monooxygenase